MVHGIQSWTVLYVNKDKLELQKTHCILQEGGFSQLTAREDTTWAGVVNVEAKCMDSVITQHSNDDYRGEYNQ